MPTETLRLGVDPRPAQKGMREYKRALDEGASASKRLADTVESNARRETSVYQRAARERLQLERQIASGRTQTARVSAVAAAEAFVRGQEQFYQANIARIKLAQARGMMSPSEARAAGQEAAAEFNAAIAGTLERRPQLAQNREAFTTLAGSIKNVGESGRSAGVGMHRLNNSLVVLARRATGAHPVMGQLTDVVGTFAIGTAAMVPILAGIAAVAAGIRLIGAEAFEARKKLRDARDTLQDLAEQQRVEAGGGAVAVAGGIVGQRLAEIAERNREINEQLQRLDADAPDPLASLAARRGVLSDRMQEITALRAEQEGLQREAAGLSKDLLAAERDAAQEAERLSARERRERLARQQEVEAAAQAHQDELTRIQEEAEALKRKLKRQHWQVEDQLVANAQAERERQSQAFHDRIVAQVEETTDRIAAEQKRRHDEEMERLKELERARERAMKNLVRGLFEVGRAFGGTTDQILSMTAAILSLERAPGFRDDDTERSDTDVAVGLGSSALTGAGFGTSTGNPFLGGAGGAIGGFSIAGPAGAIVGGVSGIITGLMEQGRRARQAAAQWEIAFRDFELMFADLTPLEEKQHRLDQRFGRDAQAAAAAYGGPAVVDTIEEAEALIETGVAGIPGISEAYIEALVRLVRAYHVNSERLEKNTSALTSNTGALNAPSGFRQSYYRWLAQGVLPDADVPSLPPTGGGGGGGGPGPDRRRGGVVYEVHGGVQITVEDSNDPTRTAEAVMHEWERMMLRGGIGPMELTRR